MPGGVDPAALAAGLCLPAVRAWGHCHLAARGVFQCNRCKHHVSPTSGTVFADTKLPLTTWFLAIYLSQNKNGISTLSLRRQLGVSPNTAGLLKHKLMSHRDFLRSQTMRERDDDRAPSGIVQMDDAYWGSERHGGGTGRGSPGKTPFVAAVACTSHGYPLRMRMDVVAGFRKTVLAAWATRYLTHGTAVVSDGLTCFPGATETDGTHVAIPTGGGVPRKRYPILCGSTRCWATSRMRCMAPITPCVRSICSVTCPSSATASIAASPPCQCDVRQLPLSNY